MREEAVATLVERKLSVHNRPNIHVSTSYNYLSKIYLQISQYISIYLK